MSALPSPCPCASERTASSTTSKCPPIHSVASSGEIASATRSDHHCPRWPVNPYANPTIPSSARAATSLKPSRAACVGSCSLANRSASAWSSSYPGAPKADANTSPSSSATSRAAVPSSTSITSLSLGRMDTEAFLRRIGVDGYDGPPRLEALSRLHEAFVDQVPYESIQFQLTPGGPLEPEDAAKRMIAREA